MSDTGAVRLLVDEGQMRKAIPTVLAQPELPMLILSGAALAALLDEAGNDEVRAVRWLERQVAKAGKPVAFELLGAAYFMAPPSWTADKTLGYIAAQRENLEAVFGPRDFDNLEWRGA